MKKIIKKIKNRAGLTLTELLVTLGILSIFSAACLTGMSTAISVRRDNIMANDAEIIASMVSSYITNELRTASGIKLEDAIDGSEITYQSNESGYKSVTLKLDENTGQLILVVDGKNDDGSPIPPVNVFSEAAYSDDKVLMLPESQRLKIKNLNFKKEPGKNTIDVSFEIGYDNADGSDTPVTIPTAKTNFTVGLMNVPKDSSETSPASFGP